MGGYVDKAGIGKPTSGTLTARTLMGPDGHLR
jgi:hypothetical protein